MKHYIIIILLIVPFLLYGQQPYNQKKISELTNEIVKEIEKTNKLIRDYRGNDIRNKLKEIASKEELIELINHPNGVVRCNTFWTLSHDKSVDLLSIILNHIEDDELINTIDDDLIWHEMVGDFFINVVTPRYIDLKSTKLDTMQRATLDSMLIYSNSKLEAKQEAILNAKPTEFLYHRIRELYVKENNQSALVTLAKYRKQEDIQLILENKYKYKKYDYDEEDDEDEYIYEYGYTYKAIQEFPHNDFISLLEKKLYETLDKTHYSNEWSVLYRAIAKYKNAKVVELLTVPFTQVKHEDIREYHMRFVYNAIRENIDEMYDFLFWKFWSEENLITPDVFQYLMEKDSIKVLELTKKNLANINQMDSIKVFNYDNYENKDKYDYDNYNFFTYSEYKSRIISVMLSFVLKHDYEFGLEVIQENIKNADVPLMLHLIKKAIEIKDSSFIEPLFKRLAEEYYSYMYLSIANVLLSYRDNTINERILKIRKTKNNLIEDWGNKYLDELLEKYNVKKGKNKK